MPETQEEWLKLARDFDLKWNLPHCLGAIDGKHVAIVKPDGAGSEYYNYKEFHSIILFAVADADYNFVFADVGCNGRVSDGGVFLNSKLYSMLENNERDMPPPEPLPSRPQVDLPYFIVGDDAFPLKSYLLKPYPKTGLTTEKRIANYRFSRARRVVENVFGIVTNRFRILQKPIDLKPDNVISVVRACCVLHNFLRSVSTASRRMYSPNSAINNECSRSGDITQGRFANVAGTCLERLPEEPTQRSTATAHEARDLLADYFMTNGIVPWQWDKACINDFDE